MVEVYASASVETCLIYVKKYFPATEVISDKMNKTFDLKTLPNVI